MEYLFDTANIEDIKNYMEIFPITGVTSNPSILKKEGKVAFFDHFKKIRTIIGMDKTLHIQVVGTTCDEMIEDAHAILENVDKAVYIKVPVNQEGLKAIRKLKQEGVNITATAIYTTAQGLLAMEAGADFIAPYFNRMENLDIDPRKVIKNFAQMIENAGYKTKILAASFKNMGQVNDAFMCGSHTATMGIDVLTESFKMPSIQKAVVDFNADWEAVYGEGTTIPSLVEE